MSRYNRAFNSRFFRAIFSNKIVVLFWSIPHRGKLCQKSSRKRGKSWEINFCVGAWRLPRGNEIRFVSRVMFVETLILWFCRHAYRRLVYPLARRNKLARQARGEVSRRKGIVPALCRSHDFVGSRSYLRIEFAKTSRTSQRTPPATLTCVLRIEFVTRFFLICSVCTASESSFDINKTVNQTVCRTEC